MEIIYMKKYTYVSTWIFFKIIYIQISFAFTILEIPHIGRI